MATSDQVHRMATFWSNVLEGDGQIFDSAADFKKAIAKYAIAHKFGYRMKRTNPNMAKAVCDLHSCDWYICASVIHDTGCFRVYKSNLQHFHLAGYSTQHKTKASKTVVADVILDKLCDCSKYRPMEIVRDISREYGVRLSYQQAWRCRELATSLLVGLQEDSYKTIPWLCRKIKESNPGSVAEYTFEQDGSFSKLFIAFSACLHGFTEGCRHLLVLDGTFIASKYKGTLLVASAYDVDDGMLPIAFGVVPSESIDNWEWYLTQLRHALQYEIGDELAFISDRHTGIIQGLHHVFPGCPHAHCLRHLKENFKKYLKGRYNQSFKAAMEAQLDKIAYLRTMHDYEKNMEVRHKMNRSAHEWVIQAHPENWVIALFKGNRYDKLNSNLAETYNAWIKDARELPICHLIDTIRLKTE
ncbi:uncharacterized protein LOC122650883 [Telopea speciosissima]|uniref:uncharacterized protein LOC122650883 n=1 Tax=Telopea speciosissima TaxID=54955 RepID=UPI001CC63FD1|nr:uncharacterized protein LOC122650883 [Telopea speciosissima]